MNTSCLALGWLLASGVLLAAGCASRTPTAAPPRSGSNGAARAELSPQALIGRSWNLVALNGAPVTAPTARSRPSLVFVPDEKRVSGMAGVNRFSGGYSMERDALKFGPLLATKMAGPPELNELEGRFLRALEQVTQWGIEGQELRLFAGNREVARFTSTHAQD